MVLDEQRGFAEEKIKGQLGKVPRIMSDEEGKIGESCHGDLPNSPRV